MKTKFLVTLLGLAFLLPGFVKADTIMLEDFEDSTLTYTGPGDAFGDLPNDDYYGRFAPDTASPPSPEVALTNIQGSGFYGVEDSDGATGGGGPLDTVVLLWSDIDTSNFENIVLSWFVAEDDDGSSEDWDPNTSFMIELSIDNGAFGTIFAVEAEDSVLSNSAPRVDTNFDGTGDGTEITDEFQQFGFSIGTASEIDIRVTFDEMTSNDEDLFFDELHLEGDFTGVPEPGTALMFTTALIGCFVRRRRA